MVTQSLTLNLPDNAYQRLHNLSKVTHQSLEQIISQSIQGNLPPVLDDVPDEWRDDAAELYQLDAAALWKVIRESLPSQQWKRHQELLEKNQEEHLTSGEQHELEELRAITDRFVFRRSYALALLKWQGYTLLPES
jgi:hypothetical protein